MEMKHLGGLQNFTIFWEWDKNREKYLSESAELIIIIRTGTVESPEENEITPILVIHLHEVILQPNLPAICLPCLWLLEEVGVMV